MEKYPRILVPSTAAQRHRRSRQHNIRMINTITQPLLYQVGENSRRTCCREKETRKTECDGDTIRTAGVLYENGKLHMPFVLLSLSPHQLAANLGDWCNVNIDDPATIPSNCIHLAPDHHLYVPEQHAVPLVHNLDGP